MNNKQININNKLIEGKVIADIGAECFYTYLTIRKYELAYADKSAFSIDLLYKTINDSLPKYNRNFTVDKIRDYIIKLKKYNLISYNYKSLQDKKEYRTVELNELPNMGSGYTYTSLDLDMVDMIIKKLSVKELMVWICLRKFANSQQITVSYTTIAQWLGVDKDACNRYGFALETAGFIANEKSKSKEKHTCNSFKVCDSVDSLDQFKSIYEKTLTKNTLARVKKRLWNRGFKISIKELENHKHLVEVLTTDELTMINELKEKHLAYALEYLLITKYDELTERTKQTEVEVEVKEAAKIINLNFDSEKKAQQTINELKKYVTLDEFIERNIRRYFEKDNGSRNMQGCFDYLENICNEIDTYYRFKALDDL